MTSHSSLADAVGRLATAFTGHLLRPADQGYDEARKVHNGLIDKRPAVVARCQGVADVVDAVKLATDQQLGVAVRGGGHNVAGCATIDDGIMIDLSLMRTVSVDPQRRIAFVQGGSLWRGVNRETQLHGPATTGGAVSSTGVAGLTLGGGLGWLMGKHALALDNLLSVELVLADGTVVTASAEEHADLFWAVRGGGGNFGVATSFAFQLHPVGPLVTGGLIAYPFEAAWDVLRYYRDATGELPDEFCVVAGLLHAADGSGTKLVAFALGHCGSLSDGEVAVAPFRRCGTPALDTVGPMPYAELNAMLDGAYPAGAFSYWKSKIAAELSDDAIRTMIDAFARCPTPMGQLIIEHLHGAVTRIGVSDTAFPHRAPGYSALVVAQWTDHALDSACIGWARDSYGALEPHLSAGRYVNYLDDDEPADAAAAAYGPNLARLRRIKAQYDPGNFFRMNQNILPAV